MTSTSHILSEPCIATVWKDGTCFRLVEFASSRFPYHLLQHQQIPCYTTTQVYGGGKVPTNPPQLKLHNYTEIWIL